MNRKLPENRYSVVFFYSLLVAGLFMFTAWKAIEEDGPDFGGDMSIGLAVGSVIRDCDFRQQHTERSCSNGLPAGLCSLKNKGISNSAQSEPGSVIVDFSVDFGPHVIYRFQKFWNSFSSMRLWSPNKGPDLDSGTSPKTAPEILQIPSGIDILKRSISGFRQGRLFYDWRSDPDPFESVGWSTGQSYLMMSNGCENAIRTYCGQVNTGNNVSPDTSSYSLTNCYASGSARYRGLRWYRLSGTGDQINILASSTGSAADIQIYQGSSQGNCDSLFCIGGAQNINVTQGSVPVNTIAGKEYFIMLANFANLSPSNNMFYTLTIECVCGSRHLQYAPPNHFTGTGTFHIRTDSTLVASNQIFSGNSVTYNAAQGMQFNSAFEVKSGAVFEARVEGCPDFSARQAFILPNGIEWRSAATPGIPQLPRRSDSWLSLPEAPDDRTKNE